MIPPRYTQRCPVLTFANVQTGYHRWRSSCVTRPSTVCLDCGQTPDEASSPEHALVRGEIPLNPDRWASVTRLLSSAR